MRVLFVLISLFLVSCNREAPDPIYLKCGSEYIILDRERGLWIRTKLAYGEYPTREQAPYISVYNLSIDENSYAVIKNNGKKGSKIDRYTLKMHTSAGDIHECETFPIYSKSFNEFWEMGLGVWEGKAQPTKEKPKPVRKI